MTITITLIDSRTTCTESVPEQWDDQRDGAFFRIVSSLFSADFVYGAGVLLASNDGIDA